MSSNFTQVLTGLNRDNFLIKIGQVPSKHQFTSVRTEDDQILTFPSHQAVDFYPKYFEEQSIDPVSGTYDNAFHNSGTVRFEINSSTFTGNCSDISLKFSLTSSSTVQFLPTFFFMDYCQIKMSESDVLCSITGRETYFDYFKDISDDEFIYKNEQYLVPDKYNNVNQLSDACIIRSGYPKTHLRLPLNRLFFAQGYNWQQLQNMARIVVEIKFNPSSLFVLSGTFANVTMSGLVLTNTYNVAEKSIVMHDEQSWQNIDRPISMRYTNHIVKTATINMAASGIYNIPLELDGIFTELNFYVILDSIYENANSLFLMEPIDAFNIVYQNNELFFAKNLECNESLNKYYYAQSHQNSLLEAYPHFYSYKTQFTPRKEITNPNFDGVIDGVLPLTNRHKLRIVMPAAVQNQVVTITTNNSGNITAGFYHFEYCGEKSASIEFDSTVAEMKAAIEGMSMFGNGSIVTCSAVLGVANTNTITITFRGIVQAMEPYRNQLIYVVSDNLSAVSRFTSVLTTRYIRGLGVAGSTSGSFRIVYTTNQIAYSTFHSNEIKAIKG